MGYTNGRGENGLTFTYKGITAEEMYLRVENDIIYTAPERDLEFIEVPGVDGDVIIDNGRYKAVERDIPARLRLPDGEDIEKSVTAILDWLSTDVQYHDLFWEGDPDFIYRAIVYSQYDIQRVLKTYGKVVLKFRYHPIKYLKEGLVDTAIQSGTVIANSFNIVAKPRITIIGTGNINVRIGNSELILQGIDGGAIVDSATQTITNLDGQRTLFDKMFSYPFPTLQSGNNTITFTGATSVSIMPRTGALI